MAEVKVQGKQLEWARKFRKFTLVQAAGQMGVPMRDLQAFERGLKYPTTTIFKRMGKIYGMPQATLLLSHPPRTESKQLKDFRTVAGDAPDIGPETSLVISRIRSYQQQLTDFRTRGFDRSTTIPRISANRDPHRAGEGERSRLGVTLEDQLGWSGSAVAFRTWRRIIEEQGICVYLEKFPLGDCRGVSILDDTGFPAILINKSEPAKEVAWIFSLMHEYAHILIGKPGISDRNFDNRIESFCNKFAAGLLMPLANLKRVVSPWPNEAMDWEAEEIRLFSRKLKVSQQALALRFESIGIANSGFYHKFKEAQPKLGMKNDTKGGPVPLATRRLHALGRRFPSVVLAAMDSGATTALKAAQILNANVSVLDKIRERLGS